MVTNLLVCKIGKEKHKQYFDVQIKNYFCEKFCTLFYYFFKIRQECYCGQSYGKYGVPQSDDCTLTCPNSKSQICGGKNSNSIWRITTTRQ